MKKITSCLLVCLMLFSCCGSVFAASAEPFSSLSITAASASAATGAKSGEVKITFSARASKTANPIGASIISIYKSDGTYVTTIYGTTANGLLASGAAMKSGSYTYKGTSGTSYYAKVTLAATAGGESDSRNITTNTARAK